MLATLEEATHVGTASLSYVECRAAFARLERDGRIAKGKRARVASRFDAFWGSVSVVEFTDKTMRRAADVARKHALRSLDAVQLASAEAFTGDVEARFFTYDRRLWLAAERPGWVRTPSEEP